MPVLKVYDEDLAAFVEVGSAASADLVEAEVVVETATTSITFSDLDGNAAGGYVLTISWKGVSATGGRYISATINGDSTSGHYFGIETYILTSGAVPGAARTNGVYVAEMGTYQPYCSSIVNIMTGHVPSFSVSTLATATSSFYSYYNLASYYQESNITSITLTCTPANEIAAGSTFCLYRRK